MDKVYKFHKRQWVEIKTKKHGVVYRKTTDVLKTIREIQKEFGEENYQTMSYSFKVAKSIPRELKQVKHRWPDNFCTILPDTSDFAVLVRERIFDGETRFTIVAGNATWSLQLEQETPFYFIVKDYVKNSIEQIERRKSRSNEKG